MLRRFSGSRVRTTGAPLLRRTVNALLPVLGISLCPRGLVSFIRISGIVVMKRTATELVEKRGREFGHCVYLVCVVI